MDSSDAEEILRGLAERHTSLPESASIEEVAQRLNQRLGRSLSRKKHDVLSDLVDRMGRALATTDLEALE